MFLNAFYVVRNEQNLTAMIHRLSVTHTTQAEKHSLLSAEVCPCSTDTRQQTGPHQSQ